MVSRMNRPWLKDGVTIADERTAPVSRRSPDRRRASVLTISPAVRSVRARAQDLHAQVAVVGREAVVRRAERPLGSERHLPVPGEGRPVGGERHGQAKTDREWSANVERLAPIDLAPPAAGARGARSPASSPSISSDTSARPRSANTVSRPIHWSSHTPSTAITSRPAARPRAGRRGALARTDRASARPSATPRSARPGRGRARRSSAAVSGSRDDGGDGAADVGRVQRIEQHRRVADDLGNARGVGCGDRASDEHRLARAGMPKPSNSDGKTRHAAPGVEGGQVSARHVAEHAHRAREPVLARSRRSSLAWPSLPTPVSTSVERLAVV